MFKPIDRLLSASAVLLFVLCSSTAFAVQVGGSGPINPVSIPGSLEVNQLVVSTTIETVQGIKLGLGDSAGTMRWTGSNFEGFDGSSWKSLDVQSTSVGWTEDVPGNKVYVTDTARNVGIGTTEPAATMDISGSSITRGNITAEGALKADGLRIDTGSDTYIETEEITIDLGGLLEGLEITAPILKNVAKSSIPDDFPFPYALGVYDRIAIFTQGDFDNPEIMFLKPDFSNAGSIGMNLTDNYAWVNWDWCPDYDGGWSLGKSDLRWKNAYFSGTVEAAGGFTVGGTPAVADGTYNFDGSASGTVSSITVTGGIITGITVRP